MDAFRSTDEMPHVLRNDARSLLKRQCGGGRYGLHAVPKVAYPPYGVVHTILFMKEDRGRANSSSTIAEISHDERPGTFCAERNGLYAKLPPIWGKIRQGVPIKHIVFGYS